MQMDSYNWPLQKFCPAETGQGNRINIRHPVCCTSPLAGPASGLSGPTGISGRMKDPAGGVLWSLYLTSPLHVIALQVSDRAITCKHILFSSLIPAPRGVPCDRPEIGI